MSRARMDGGGSGKELTSTPLAVRSDFSAVVAPMPKLFVEISASVSYSSSTCIYIGPSI